MPFDGPAPMSTPSPKPLAIRERLSEVRYEIRGELARRARELEAQGSKLIKLNIGNPGNFGFRAPEHLQRAIADEDLLRRRPMALLEHEQVPQQGGEHGHAGMADIEQRHAQAQQFADAVGW